jgi:hypothetical protein
MTLFAVTASKLSKGLGYGMPTSSILSGVALTVCIFFYLYIIGSFFRIPIYPLIDRVTVYTVFQDYVINQHLDYAIVILAAASWYLLSLKKRPIRYYFSLAYGGCGVILALISPDNIIFDTLALLSLPLIIILILYHSRKRHKDLLYFNAKLTWRYICLAVIAFSALGIAFSVFGIFLTPIFDYQVGEDPANELFLLLSSFSTIYIFPLVLCLFVKVLQKGVLKIFKLDIKQDISQTLPDQYDKNKLKSRTKIGILVLAMILSIILVLIPQHPLINKDNRNIGVDTRWYVTWVGELAKSKNVSDLIHQAFVVQTGGNGDRPLSLLFFFGVYKVVGGNLSEIMEHIPIILGPGTVVAFYFLTLELTRNEKVAVIAAFFGAVSFHTLIGIYAGFYANWIALILGYISIAFLFRYLRSGHVSDIVVFSTIFIGVLLTHVYTWTVFAVVLGTFLVVILLATLRKKIDKKKSNSKNIGNIFTEKRIILLLLAIFLSIVVNITLVALIGSNGGVERDIHLAQTNLGIEQFNVRWRHLDATMHGSLGGVFSSFIILLLGLFWVIKSNMREPGTLFLIIFLSAGMVPLTFGLWTLQTRVLYDIPFEIPAAIALYYISTRSGSRLVTLAAACTWLVAISLVTVMNYYLVWRPGVQ